MLTVAQNEEGRRPLGHGAEASVHCGISYNPDTRPSSLMDLAAKFLGILHDVDLDKAVRASCWSAFEQVLWRYVEVRHEE